MVPEDTLSTIGRYQIIEKVGQGGMGVVYRAHDTLLEREVALKIISASIEGNPELRERFFREARAAGQLSHRNIITIHDLGEHEGQPYLAMEFLNGEDLQRRLSRPEPMSLARKLEIAADICDGLAYAHRRGLIHRDIKPANIFITDEGVVKLLDFGLARMVTSELTASNMMLGTLNYMAPEQVRGERTDHRADIFSFGVVLYEMLSGRKAFQGDSFATDALQDPAGRARAAAQHRRVAAVRGRALVEKAIAKTKDERYQDLIDLARDLALHRQHLALSDSERVAIPVPAALRAPSTHRTSSDPPRSSGAAAPRLGRTGRSPRRGRSTRLRERCSPTPATTIAPARGGVDDDALGVVALGGGVAALIRRRRSSRARCWREPAGGSRRWPTPIRRHQHHRRRTSAGTGSQRRTTLTAVAAPPQQPAVRRRQRAPARPKPRSRDGLGQGGAPGRGIGGRSARPLFTAGARRRARRRAPAGCETDPRGGRQVLRGSRAVPQRRADAEHGAAPRPGR